MRPDETGPTDVKDFYFQWHLTNLCNHRCQHCYHERFDSKNELESKDLLRIVDEIGHSLAAWNIRGSVALTGGEPLVRRDELHAVLDALHRSPRIEGVDILTNGSLLDEYELDRLRDYTKLRRIQLSLEGATARTHDRIRGIGDYDRVIQTIRQLKKHGFRLSVMTTVTRVNHLELVSIMELLAELNVDFFALERFIPAGQSSGLAAWRLSPRELQTAFQTTCDWGLSHVRPTVLMYRTLFALCSADNPSVGAMCSAGMNALTLMPNGDIYPCRRLPIKIGNVFEEGIIRTWFCSDVLWKIRQVRNLGGKCGICDKVGVCRGCRAFAYAVTGDYLSEDPQCWA